MPTKRASWAGFDEMAPINQSAHTPSEGGQPPGFSECSPKASLTCPVLRDGIEDTLKDVKGSVASIARLLQVDSLEVVVPVETSVQHIAK
jgi:hypothetical protein